jgi:DNA-binding response OmpR family regulator
MEKLHKHFTFLDLCFTIKIMNFEEQKKVLIIEDEPDIVLGLKDALEFEGYKVLAASSGKQGIQFIRYNPHCIILDLMLPDINGYIVCKKIRQINPTVPIIILTAKAQENDKIRGLDMGADDYVTKPFSIGELLARIRAIFRRASLPPKLESTFKIGEIEINTRTHTLTKNRKTFFLSFYEVELLKLLYEYANRPVSREEILRTIWGITPSSTNRTVDNFIVKLRKKIEDSVKKPKHILTIYGFGYKLVL